MSDNSNPDPIDHSRRRFLNTSEPAVVLTIANGNIRRARIALGGVGTKPWRSPEAEDALTGKPQNDVTFRQAAEAALKGAKPQSENRFTDRNDFANSDSRNIGE